MADKNIQMKRKRSDGGFDNHYPITKAQNVLSSQPGKNIEQVLGDHIDTSASTTQKGHVQLSSSVTSTSTTMAATPSAVRDAYNRANPATIRTDSSQKLRAEVRSSAPVSPVNGDIWYNSATHKFQGRANGAWV